MSKITKEEILAYHEGGKVAMSIAKPCESARDLSMAYTPGVAEPCLEIEKDPAMAYRYTAKGNLVAVISNGTAVLGLGDIGALASKPVMEGKSVLFKKFAGIDSVDIEINEKDPGKIVEICTAISQSFGGINLEDIAAPHCFEIEQKLKAATDIPVMHDDQHGTAIITAAALINALDLTGKDIASMKIVVVGAGAAGIACAKMYRSMGAEQIVMVDSKGVVHAGRDDLADYKREFALSTDDRTLADAMQGADMVLGLSRAGLIKPEMVASMAADPIIFALANPVPEILPEEVLKVRSDVMMGTGRTDYPNQVNNVLGFPFIFRGALDVRATAITDGMKMAAAKSLAMLAREPVPQYVCDAYGGKPLVYGRDYLIPKPFDKRVLLWEASAVAKAAFDEGVAGIDVFDMCRYRNSIASKIGLIISEPCS